MNFNKWKERFVTILVMILVLIAIFAIYETKVVLDNKQNVQFCISEDTKSLCDSLRMQYASRSAELKKGFVSSQGQTPDQELVKAFMVAVHSAPSPVPSK